MKLKILLKLSANSTFVLSLNPTVVACSNTTTNPNLDTITNLTFSVPVNNANT